MENKRTHHADSGSRDTRDIQSHLTMLIKARKANDMPAIEKHLEIIRNIANYGLKMVRQQNMKDYYIENTL